MFNYKKILSIICTITITGSSVLTASAASRTTPSTAVVNDETLDEAASGDSGSTSRNVNIYQYYQIPSSLTETVNSLWNGGAIQNNLGWYTGSPLTVQKWNCDTNTPSPKSISVTGALGAGNANMIGDAQITYNNSGTSETVNYSMIGHILQDNLASNEGTSATGDTITLAADSTMKSIGTTIGSYGLNVSAVYAKGHNFILYYDDPDVASTNSGDNPMYVTPANATNSTEDVKVSESSVGPIINGTSDGYLVSIDDSNISKSELTTYLSRFAPTKNGYTFKGWYDANGNIILNKDYSASIASATWNAHGNQMKLYAKWENTGDKMSVNTYLQDFGHGRDNTDSSGDTIYPDDIDSKMVWGTDASGNKLSYNDAISSWSSGNTIVNKTYSTLPIWSESDSGFDGTSDDSNYIRFHNASGKSYGIVTLGDTIKTYEGYQYWFAIILHNGKYTYYPATAINTKVYQKDKIYAYYKKRNVSIEVVDSSKTLYNDSINSAMFDSLSASGISPTYTPAKLNAATDKGSNYISVTNGIWAGTDKNGKTLYDTKYTFEYGATVQLEYTITDSLQKNGTLFEGWKLRQRTSTTSADYIDVSVPTDNKSLSAITDEDANTNTIKATDNWTFAAYLQTAYTISYLDESATAESMVVTPIVEGADIPEEYNYGKEVTLPSATKAGYTFEGWALKSTSGIGTDYEKDTSGNIKLYKTLSAGEFGNKTFYAVWAQNNDSLKITELFAPIPADAGTSPANTVSNINFSTGAQLNATWGGINEVGTPADKGAIKITSDTGTKISNDIPFIIYPVSGDTTRWLQIDSSTSYYKDGLGNKHALNAGSETYTLQTSATDSGNELYINYIWVDTYVPGGSSGGVVNGGDFDMSGGAFAKAEKIHVHDPVVSPAVITDPTGYKSTMVITNADGTQETKTVWNKEAGNVPGVQLVNTSFDNSSDYQLQLDGTYHIAFDSVLDSAINNETLGEALRALNGAKQSSDYSLQSILSFIRNNSWNTDDGNKENKYTYEKYIHFPFPVVIAGVYYPTANGDKKTWIQVSKLPSSAFTKGKSGETNTGVENGGAMSFNDDNNSGDGTASGTMGELNQIQFYIPSWIDESGFSKTAQTDKKYKIEFLVSAINSRDANGAQYSKDGNEDSSNSSSAIRNENITNGVHTDADAQTGRDSAEPYYNEDDSRYYAYYSLAAQVSGRIFDFQITGTTDGDTYSGYSKTLDNAQIGFCGNGKSSNGTGNNKTTLFAHDGTSGQRDILSGTVRSTDATANSQNLMPLSIGKSNAYSGMGVMSQGTEFTYLMKTMGDLAENETVDSSRYISIKPSYRYVYATKGKSVSIPADKLSIYYVNEDGRIVKFNNTEYASFVNSSMSSQVALDKPYGVKLGNEMFKGTLLADDINKTILARNSNHEYSKDTLLNELVQTTRFGWIEFNSKMQRLYSGNDENLIGNSSTSNLTTAYTDKRGTDGYTSDVNTFNHYMLNGGIISEAAIGGVSVTGGEISAAKPDNNTTNENATYSQNLTGSSLGELYKRSMQTWYGAYAIPNKIYVCYEGNDNIDVDGDGKADIMSVSSYGCKTGDEYLKKLADETTPIDKAPYSDKASATRYDKAAWLNTGYLVLNFEIITYDKKGNQHLSYYAPNNTEAAVEGIQTQAIVPDVKNPNETVTIPVNEDAKENVKTTNDNEGHYTTTYSDNKKGTTNEIAIVDLSKTKADTLGVNQVIIND